MALDKSEGIVKDKNLLSVFWHRFVAREVEDQDSGNLTLNHSPVESQFCNDRLEENPQARLLMTQPEVGPNTALAYVLTIGDVSRFRRGKQVASYLGLIPREESSGGRQKLGAITKQGNRMLRSLLVEAAQVAVMHDPGLRKQYLHRCHQKAKGVAKVAVARKLAVRLYWMLRTQTPYPEIVRIESSPRVALVGAS